MAESTQTEPSFPAHLTELLKHVDSVLSTYALLSELEGYHMMVTFSQILRRRTLFGGVPSPS